MLATLAVLMMGFWIGFTHLQGRFFVLIIPVGALLLSQLERAIFVVFAASAIALQCLLTIGLVTARFEPVRSAVVHDRAFGLQAIEDIIPDSEIRDLAKSNWPIDMVGDAKAFFYKTPKLRYRTVFDVKEGKPDQPLIEIWLDGPARPDAYILIDPGEINRLSRTYYRIPNLPPDAPGVGGPPFVMPPQK
jgi:hypothetical protein